MLAEVSPKQAQCLLNAARCRGHAERAQSSLDKDEYLEMAERWELLARTYGFSARLKDFIASLPDKPER
jgi:hypothetical protein